MVWVISLVALGVLGLAAFAANGGLGEMPDPVDSKPVGRVPDGPLATEDLRDIVFPVAFSGYNPREVDDFLEKVAEGDWNPEEVDLPTFSVVRNGYRMSQVDDVFDRLAGIRNNVVDSVEIEMRDPDGSDEATHR